MILWLNGAFGAGKTTVAEELCRCLPDAFLFDPENVGQFLRQNLPGPLCPWEDFQDDPLWRQFTAAMLARLAAYGGWVVVPMTVVSFQYWQELTALLREEDLRTFVLWAEPDTLKARLAGRGEDSDSWPMRQIVRCCRGLMTLPGQIISTDNLKVEQIISTILSSIKGKIYK